MTQLLDGEIEVSVDGDGRPVALRAAGSAWRAVTRVTNAWRVETDWWRSPVCRDYLRVLVDGDCLEIHRDRGTGAWRLSRRYD